MGIFKSIKKFGNSRRSDEASSKSQPQIEEPMDQIPAFKHTSLKDATRQIRLLRFLPAETSSEALRFEMTQYDIEKTPMYHAISYHWGDVTQTEAIVVDKQALAVGINCHYALWQYTRHFANTLVWIDSICINQGDDQEKSAQVQMMGSIYRNANLVAASVGPHADGSEHICRGEYHMPALKSFAKRPYWSRLWIIQELYLAPCVWILCGEDVIEEWKESHCHMFSHRTRQDLAPFSVLMAEKNMGQKVFELLNAVQTFSGFKCRDSHDHIYGILALCNPKTHDIIADYSTPLTSLALSVARLSADAVSFAKWIRRLIQILEISADALSDNKSIIQQALALPPDHVDEQAKALLSELLTIPRRTFFGCGPPRLRKTHPGWYIEDIWTTQRLQMNEDGQAMCQVVRIESFYRRNDDYAVDAPATTLEHELGSLRPLLDGNGRLVGYISQHALTNDTLVSPFHALSEEWSPLLLVSRRMDGNWYRIVGQGLLFWGNDLPSSWTGPPAKMYTHTDVSDESVKSWLLMKDEEAFAFIAQYWFNISALLGKAPLSALDFDVARGMSSVVHLEDLEMMKA